jgi:cation diffusion facilitator CzcD-associated flavoprotein CzcO
VNSIAIIGAGFGGFAAAIELKRAGYDDIVIFERADDVGGVWRENTYPGAACDVPSPLYSFSFEPNPRWPRRYSTQPVILDYLRGVAAKYDLKRHIRFSTSVQGADYDEASGRWTVHTLDGGAEVDVLITAVGQLSRPAAPNIEGRDVFGGISFHSAEWDHSVDLDGKRVGVIGTGASAIQFVPQIQPQVAHLALFQRSTPYILPRWDTEFTERHHRIFERLPVTQLAERFGWYAYAEAGSVALLYSKTVAKPFVALARRNLEKHVADPELRAKLWPDYPLGCKRVLFSNDYLPALAQPNVDLVTDGIAEITETGIRTTNGVCHEVDVIIYGTGFTANDFLAPLTIRGAGGRELREEWSEGARAYLGVSVPHFPNLFLMYGPNTNLGAGSIVAMLERQARYIRKTLKHFGGRPVAVRAEVAESYDRALQARLVDGVWSMCSSWYRGPNGRVSTNWPGTVTEYRARTARFNPADYEVSIRG